MFWMYSGQPYAGVQGPMVPDLSVEGATLGVLIGATWQVVLTEHGLEGKIIDIDWALSSWFGVFVMSFLILEIICYKS